MTARYKALLDEYEHYCSVLVDDWGKGWGVRFFEMQELLKAQCPEEEKLAYWRGIARYKVKRGAPPWA
jgi:hypothetical protein